MWFPSLTVQALGLPEFEQAFYVSILGAVLIGIAIALLIESRRKRKAFVGLGLGGAIAINLCGGLCLAGWLVFGGFEIPIRGHIILWTLVVVLVGISGLFGTVLGTIQRKSFSQIGASDACGVNLPRAKCVVPRLRRCRGSSSQSGSSSTQALWRSPQ
jgi:uncharacterized membrane protein